jgi:hypothetical protein
MPLQHSIRGYLAVPIINAGCVDALRVMVAVIFVRPYATGQCRVDADAYRELFSPFKMGMMIIPYAAAQSDGSLLLFKSRRREKENVLSMRRWPNAD